MFPVNRACVSTYCTDGARFEIHFDSQNYYVSLHAEWFHIVSLPSVSSLRAPRTQYLTEWSTCYDLSLCRLCDCAEPVYEYSGTTVGSCICMLWILRGHIWTEVDRCSTVGINGGFALRLYYFNALWGDLLNDVGSMLHRRNRPTVYPWTEAHSSSQKPKRKPIINKKACKTLSKKR